MNYIKKIIRLFFNESQIRQIKAYIHFFKTYRNSKNRFEICENNAVTQIIGQKRQHIFCGYFDLNPLSPDNNKNLLIHIMPKGAICGKDCISLAIVNIDTLKITKFATTTAWCWQMGARLRWSAKGTIYYNSYVNDHYKCVEYDLNQNKVIREFCDAFYDIDNTCSFALSVNFERLQRLRPGYGYACMGKDNSSIEAPENDGLFYIDMNTNNKKLLISLKELSEYCNADDAGAHYINHISISPDGENAIFFHIWVSPHTPGWKANLCVVNIKNGNFKYLEKSDQVSHYAWKNNQEVLITAMSSNSGKYEYRLYNIHTGQKQLLNSSDLRQDGHPVYSKSFDGFYSDTYPDKNDIQRFFRFSKQRGYKEILRLYSDPRLFGEKRCDLHPHYCPTEEIIALDSTFQDKRRQVILVNLKECINEK